jgi:hypothetical protein
MTSDFCLKIKSNRQKDAMPACNVRISSLKTPPFHGTEKAGNSTD